MPTPHMWTLIQRYITGSCPKEEQMKVEKWMDEDPANRELVDEVNNIWELSSEEEFDVNVQTAWTTFRDREIKGEANAIKNSRKGAGVRQKMLPVFRAAAAILLAAFVGWFSWQSIDQGAEKVASISTVMQTLETGNGERAQLTFSDGTVVTLNSGSTLEYPKAFRETQRKVKLRGEAYFEVAPNKDRPFIVDAGMAEVEVLGTKFNVRAWSMVGVGVREGKVAVNAQSTDLNTKERVLLTKGEYASVIENKGLSEVQAVDVEKEMLWLTGGMHFDNEPFSDVVKRLERNFNVHIKITDQELRTVPFTGTFQKAELGEVLDVISASMGVDYRRSDTLVTF
ncbi:FecR family protein [Fodinibius salsisoli]|uniref:FecR domain-containing protein n=1 Tax=Fodinibius salsisoli TaxID=2820877 RepID=A0ABT3PL51_9BACT|nr:FecR domain-containing protein [Fodinibius salsisoli]MCW9706483.1 FecR domain-containing protein [Fodinibius salsisoli]